MSTIFLILKMFCVDGGEYAEMGIWQIMHRNESTVYKINEM